MSTRPGNDRITLVGVKLRPRIGVTLGERRLPQLCQADVTVWGDFESAGSTDQLDEALDYSRMLQTVLGAAHDREFNLLECLAYRIARDLLQVFPARKVQVRVRKRPAALMEKLEYIEVEVEES